VDKRQLGPCVTFFPQPTTLIASRNAAAEVNLMTASWVGVVSKTPPTIAVSLNRGRQTYANIRQRGEFSVNMVPEELALQADLCGIRSGRDLDKPAVTGLRLEQGSQLDVPLVDACPLNLECRYLQEVELGDYRLVLGEIVEVHAVEAAFAGTGMSVEPFAPLVYLGGVREYWSLGDKVATAYRDGLGLLKDDA